MVHATNLFFYLFEINHNKQSLPELPKGHDDIAGNNLEIKQLWNSKGELCPNGTIPIRRTSDSDIISISKFGNKYSRKDIPGK
ncbi:putative neprosin activation peptide [Helianthus anomalus]